MMKKAVNVLFLLVAFAAALPAQVERPNKFTAKHTAHETSFVVYPADANHNYPMLFGGKVLAEMDRCAGVTVRRLLYTSPLGARDAVTVGIDDVKFHKAGQVKDLVFVAGKVVKLGQKSITVRVTVERELATEEREILAEGTFTFCSYDTATKKAVEHGLSLKE